VLVLSQILGVLPSGKQSTWKRFPAVRLSFVGRKIGIFGSWCRGKSIKKYKKRAAACFVFGSDASNRQKFLQAKPLPSWLYLSAQEGDAAEIQRIDGPPVEFSLSFSRAGP
jgi:hypothetical protein